MSSTNPFRNPTPSRAQEEVLLAPPSPPLPPLPQHTHSDKLPALPPQPPTSGLSSQSENQASSSHEILSASSAVQIMENIDDDLPPPYTPAANIGEETVSLGPRRPFQQPPPLPPSLLHRPPGQRPHSNCPPQPIPPPPPRGPYVQPDPQGLAPWQTQYQYRRRQNMGGGLLGALFDTVREIADAVSGTQDERTMALQNANAAAYAAPYPSTRSGYGPPPGPPPPPRPASAPPQSPPAIPDDGSPTRTPLPGHPLLRDGNLLVYPKDHLCVKCEFLRL